MAPITVSIDIDAPIAEVWAAAADLASHGQWMGDVESITFDSESRKGPGAIMRVATKVGPLRTIDVLEVVAWEPPKLIAIAHRGIFTGRGEFRLTAVGGATRFIWMEEIVFPKLFGGPFGAILTRPVLSSIWRRNLRRFKSLLES